MSRITISSPLTRLGILLALLPLVLTMVTGTVACSPFPGNWPSEGDADRSFLYPVIAITVALVVIAAAASDVDTAALADSSEPWNCSVTNRTSQPFLLYANDQLVGRIETGATARYLLGVGAHSLAWEPLEYGFEFYDLRQDVEVVNQRCYWEIKLDEVE